MSEKIMRSIVESLALPNGRPVGSAGHDQARAYLLRQMKAAGLEGSDAGCGFELPFCVGGQEFCNLIGRLPGRDPTQDPMLIGAHYDTCGEQPGADDNAAAIAIALTAIPQLRDLGLKRSILIAFFDSEEPPWFLTPSMGSIHFYHEQRKEPVHFSLIMDLVGHDVPMPGLQDLLFLTGMESDPGLESIVIDNRKTQGIRVVPTLNSYIGDLSDHHAFRLDKRPYLFLSCGHWEHYHQATDTPEKLNYSKMASIRDFMIAAIRQADAAPLDGPFEGYDTTPTEIEFMKEVFEPYLQQFGMQLNSRSDVDKLVLTLLSMGL